MSHWQSKLLKRELQSRTAIAKNRNSPPRTIIKLRLNELPYSLDRYSRIYEGSKKLLTFENHYVVAVLVFMVSMLFCKNMLGCMDACMQVLQALMVGVCQVVRAHWAR
jgi:hypothetical protein